MVKNLTPQFLENAIQETFETSYSSSVLLDMEEIELLLLGKGDDYPSRTLSASEREKYHSFKMKKRQREWLAGRICAKMAIDGLALHDQQTLHWSNITISNAASGRPYIKYHQDDPLLSKLDLSISHSNTFAFALVTDKICGVDIQVPRPTLSRVKEKFCVGKEDVQLQKDIEMRDEIPALTLLWAAKESIRKAYSLQFIPEFLHLELNSTVPGGESWWKLCFNHRQIEPTVIAGFFQSYGIAVCIT